MSFRLGILGLLMLAPLAGCDRITSPQVTRTTIMISSTRSGVLEDRGSVEAWVSDDGNSVAFVSGATNLVSDQTSPVNHVYVKNRIDGSIALATRNSDFGNTPASCNPQQVYLSSTGRYVVFGADAALDNAAPGTTGILNIFVRDLELGITSRAIDRTIWPNLGCFFPSISEDGRFVVFITNASNLGFGNPGLLRQVFVSDLSTNPPTLRLVSHVPGNSTGFANGYCGKATITADGKKICYESGATNLAPLQDADTNPDVYVAAFDSFVVADSTVVSFNSAGVKGNAGSNKANISPNGRYVAFLTVASNMGPGPNNIMRRDLTLGETVCVTTTTDGLGPNNSVDEPRVSGDGVVVFLSNASNLTADASSLFQPYILTALGLEEVSVNDSGQLASASGFSLSISTGGLWVVWVSDSGNLVLPDTNGAIDVFARGPYDR